MIDPAPHKLLVRAPSAVRDAQGVVVDKSLATGVEVAGQLSPVSSDYAFQRYGVEAVRGREFLFDPGHAAEFRLGALCEGMEGDEVDLTGKTYEVASPSKVWEYGHDADCGGVLLEELI